MTATDQSRPQEHCSSKIASILFIPSLLDALMDTKPDPYGKGVKRRQTVSELQKDTKGRLSRPRNTTSLSVYVLTSYLSDFDSLKKSTQVAYCGGVHGERGI